MRDSHLQAIDNKIKRIRFYKLIGKMLFGTILIILLILIFSSLNQVLMMQTDTLNKLSDVGMEVDEVKESINQAENLHTEQIEPIGTFTVTHYCPCAKCCGKSDGITATGTQATEGRTIAVDPSVIPLGTEVEIDGHTYIAEDVGGAIKGNKVDIFVNDHETAIQRGKFEREVRYEF